MDINSPLLPKNKIHELAMMISGQPERIDANVEIGLNKIAEEFVLSTSKYASLLAKHRKSKIMEGKDVNLGIMMNYDINMGGNSVVSNIEPPHPSHLQNIALVSRDQYNLENASWLIIKCEYYELLLYY